MAAMPPGGDSEGRPRRRPRAGDVLAGVLLIVLIVVVALLLLL